MKNNVMNSLSTKIILSITVISIVALLLIFTVFEKINKEAFYDIEMGKADLIARTIEPLIAVNIYLDMRSKIDQITRQLIKNPNILAVTILKNNQMIHEIRSKEYAHGIEDSFIVEKNIFQPNSKKKIGTLVLVYSSKNYKDLINRYTKVLFVMLFVFGMIFLLFSLYVRKLLSPLRKIAKALKYYAPNKEIDIPFVAQNSEIGLISSALNDMQQKISQYSKEQQNINHYLETMNISLESRIAEAVQKSREQELKMLQQSRLAQMGEMISMIAHQWRQPLSAIASTAASLNVKVSLNRYEKEYFSENIEKISHYSQHLSSTIDDFRNFFKSNKSQEEFFMREVVEGSLTIIGSSLKNKNIEVNIDYASQISVYSYFNELKQVCLNIIKNAEDILLDKAVEEPRIWIRTYNGDNEVTLEIADNGGGIDLEIIDKIFDPYFTTKEQSDGTGLGLYMSKTIVKEHCGGQLKVTNSDIGAVFTITLDSIKT